MDFLIVTGLSGAGKSSVIHALEDIGYFCSDNIPPELLKQLFEICMRSDKDGRFAAVLDVRSRRMSGDLIDIKRRLTENQRADVRLLFLDASDEVLIRRYKETRRRHPLMDQDIHSVQQAIALERNILNDVHLNADYSIDSTSLSSAQIKERVTELFSKDSSSKMSVDLLSFGFKYGLPADADLVFDVRCLPNPHYVENLRPQTGVDKPVQEYIFGFEESKVLLEKIYDLVSFLLPLYSREGKSHLVIAIGCTGGKHRSVASVEEIAGRVGKDENVVVTHRDYRR